MPREGSWPELRKARGRHRKIALAAEGRRNERHTRESPLGLAWPRWSVLGGGEVGEGEWSSERWKRGRRGKSIMDPERLGQDQFGGGMDRGSVWGMWSV